jgi:Tfp pilus assembly protein PilX
MRTPASSRKDATRQRGVALIVTLSMLVLLTAATLAFFTRATANRTIENSRANKVLADQLAKTGADYAAGLFLGEIDSGSTKATNNGFVIYRPSNVTNAVPQRILAQAGLTNDANFFNLVRQTTDGTHNSAALSQNGRAMTTSRWNAPILLGGAGFTATNQLPNWIYVETN